MSSPDLLELEEHMKECFSILESPMNKYYSKKFIKKNENMIRWLDELKQWRKMKGLLCTDCLKKNLFGEGKK
jgi:hypothetical protein